MLHSDRLNVWRLLIYWAMEEAIHGQRMYLLYSGECSPVIWTGASRILQVYLAIVLKYTLKLLE